MSNHSMSTAIRQAGNKITILSADFGRISSTTLSRSITDKHDVRRKGWDPHKAPPAGGRDAYIQALQLSEVRTVNAHLTKQLRPTIESSGRAQGT